MADFCETYRSLADDAVLKLWAERSQLTSAARASLANEIRRRSLTQDAQGISEITLDEPVKYPEPLPPTEGARVVAQAGVIAVITICSLNFASALLGILSQQGGVDRQYEGALFLLHIAAYFLGWILLPIALIFTIALSFSNAISEQTKLCLWGMLGVAVADWFYLNYFAARMH